jgi:hypothetical protein
MARWVEDARKESEREVRGSGFPVAPLCGVHKAAESELDGTSRQAWRATVVETTRMIPKSMSTSRWQTTESS